jgi:protocatechuate 3,4-dioxygenase alpha subunit
MVPLPFGAKYNQGAKISWGACNGLEDLIGMTDVRTGRTLVEYLQASVTFTPGSVVVAGHSLGGALASVLTPYLYETLGRPNNRPADAFLALTFAAPTAGDAMIELWQADAQGRYTEADPNFCGFGRLETDLGGVCVFETIKPGRVAGADGKLQAPHINVTVFARGLLKHLHTRVYFAGEASNAEDAALALAPEERCATLLAQPVAGQAGTWRMEIRLQGERETVFFDV